LSAVSQNTCIPTSLVVRSDSLKRVMKLVEQVARHPAAVLVVGETGTGKEMIARSIHNCSLRCNNAWIDVNCAAIPEHLVESELFGYEKGAFSGADTLKPGLFELADKGTLFLDEIGDLDLKVQVKLLRVLDGVPYYRLGGSKKVGVDVRVVAATNQDLEELVRAGRFRSDLYHRLAQFKLEIPPLRERPEDILGIAEQLLHEHYPQSSFTSDAVRAMFAYAWQGNVRELKNAIFRTVLVAKNPQVHVTAADLNLPEVTFSSSGTGSPTANGHATPNGNGHAPAAAAVPVGTDLNQVEKQMIFQALERFGGNQGKAAEALGISRRTLIRKLKSYREAGAGEIVGTLQVEQQRYYRAHVSVPVTLKYADEQFEATLLNISLGGAAVNTDRILKCGMEASICFLIPETDVEAELSGKITWAGKDGQHGIQFGDIPAHIRTNLQRWLLSQMKKDGWNLEFAV